jgi:putative hemolysin
VAVPRVLANLVAGIAFVLWIGGVPLQAGGSAGAVLPEMAAAISVGELLLGVLVAGVAIWAFSIALPLAIAEHAAARVVLLFALPIRGIAFALSPLRGIVAFTTEIVRRLAGEAERNAAEAREAELLSLVEESEREGDLDESAREMIEAVVEFRSTTVEQIMTPRTDIQGLESTDDLDAVKSAAAAATHSRIPVYDETIDSIRGVLYLKDLLRWLVSEEGASGPFSLAAVTRDATFVPETKTVRELLTELLEQKVHIAFATDEYGGISGLVTIEDIIEEVFGEIRDEYEPEDKPDPRVVVDLDTRSAEIDGRIEVDDANDELESIGIELPEADDWDTVGGFVVTTMGKIPETGETLVHDGVEVTILEAEPTRVVRVKVAAARESAPA